MSDPFKPAAGAEGCLSDESKLSGRSAGICFPATPEEAAAAVKYARDKGYPLTLQGGLTGIVGGAVPDDTRIINTSRLKRIGPVRDDNTLYVDAGVSLDELRGYISPKGLYFPPDPTEASAFLGGMAASNASGAVSYGYGPMRNWIEELFLVTSDGEMRRLSRGAVFARGREFELFGVRGALPDVHPVDVKSAAGLFVRPDMDMIDLFIGCEGILALITGMTVRLIGQPEICGAIMFLRSEEAAFRLVDTLRRRQDMNTVALEYFDGRSLDLLEYMKREKGVFEKVKPVPEGARCAVYAELHVKSDAELDALLEITEEFGISEEDMLCGFDAGSVAPLKTFRHAVPEAVNMLVAEKKRSDPSITKLGTDMSVPDRYLAETVAMYRSDLEASGLRSVIFGHIGNNHLHVNIIPENSDEYLRGKELYKGWARRISALGGSVSAEHGIGKLKKDFLALMYSPEELEGMRYLKRCFDPENILSKGNMI